MPNIPAEYILSFVAVLVAWGITLIVKTAMEAYGAYKAANPSNSYLLDNVFQKGYFYGEQLILKHGITDRAEVERRVLLFVNQYMIACGYAAPSREFAEAMIKAIVREHNQLVGK